MNIKSWLKNLFAKLVASAVDIARYPLLNIRNADIVLAWAMQKPRSKDIAFPIEYVELVRGCLERKSLKVCKIKNEPDNNSNVFAKRFSTLLESLPAVPPIEYSVAEDIACIADSYRRNLAPIEGPLWAGDIRAHFELSSSFGIKGRILSTIVRIMRSEQCLELGTAYGMSTMFILETLKACVADFHLTTLEGSEQQFAISSKTLKDRYSHAVSCELGLTQEALPQMVKSLKGLDFLFHDAGHSKESYIRDFQAVLPILKPGSVALIDDIRWEGERFYKGDPQCYEGWKEIVSHPRVKRAAEISDTMGLVLLGE